MGAAPAADPVLLNEQELTQYRFAFEHVHNRAPNRLTISTFLGGFTLATFAAQGQLSSQLNQLDWFPDWLRWLKGFWIGGIDVLLGFASLLLLATVYLTYVAYRHLEGLEPDDREKRSDQHGLPTAPGTTVSVRASTTTILQESVRYYERPRDMVRYSVVLLAFGLVLIGGRINPWVFLILGLSGVFVSIVGLRRDIGCQLGGQLSVLFPERARSRGRR